MFRPGASPTMSVYQTKLAAQKIVPKNIIAFAKGETLGAHKQPPAGGIICLNKKTSMGYFGNLVLPNCITNSMKAADLMRGKVYKVGRYYSD